MKRITPSLVISLIALFVAAGGVAGAASGLITSAQIKNGTIQTVDMSAGAKAALRGQRGAQGPQGPGGAVGPAGGNGGFDPAKVSYVQGPAQSIAGGGVATLVATCPAGTKVIGGGYIGATLTGAEVPINNGWSVVVGNIGSTATTSSFAVAICAAP